MSIISNCALCFQYSFKDFLASLSYTTEGNGVYSTSLAEWKGDEKFFSIRATLSTFKKQALHGCVICSMLVEGVAQLYYDEHWRSLYYDKLFPADLIVSAAEDRIRFLEIIRGAPRPTKRVPQLTFFVLDDEISPDMLHLSESSFSPPQPWTHLLRWWTLRQSNDPVVYKWWDHPVLPTAWLVMESPESERCYQLIQWWANRCATAHSSCRPNEMEPLPSRVLDVGPPDGSRNPFLHVTHSEMGRYLTLSHRWGKIADPLLTTKCTLKDRENGISWETLPKTFQDAIVITRKLGVQYLWIDSLCIIQDDERDWEAEAAKMDSIYERAYLTISATRSKDSGDGIFDHRTGTHLIHRQTDGIRKLAFARRDISHDWLYRASNDNIYWSMIDDEQDYPVMSRAWCFQERLLSARVIHYAQHELVYECCLCAVCECEMTNRAETLKVQWANALQLTETTSLLEYWRILLQNYCAKYLSYSGDQLVALSGVARRFHKEDLLGRYVAGLWETDLAYNLLWLSEDFEGGRPVHRPSGQTRTQSAYLAPTFSWASRVGPIKWWTEGEEDPGHSVISIGPIGEQRVKILELQCIASGENVYGKVRGGFLKAAGFLISGSMEGAPNDDSLRLKCTAKNESLNIPFFADSIDDTKLSAGAVVHFLQLFSTQEVSHGLVLQGVKLSSTIQGDFPHAFKSSPNIFIRIGVFFQLNIKAFDDAKMAEVVIM